MCEEWLWLFDVTEFFFNCVGRLWEWCVCGVERAVLRTILDFGDCFVFWGERVCGVFFFVCVGVCL